MAAKTDSRGQQSIDFAKLMGWILCGRELEETHYILQSMLVALETLSP